MSPVVFQGSLATRGLPTACAKGTERVFNAHRGCPSSNKSVRIVERPQGARGLNKRLEIASKKARGALPNQPLQRTAPRFALRSR